MKPRASGGGTAATQSGDGWVPALGRPVLVVEATGGRGPLRAQRPELGAQLSCDRLQLAHAVGEGAERLLDSCRVVPLARVRQLVRLGQLAHLL